MFRELIKQEKLHGAIKWLLVLVIIVPMVFFGAMWVGSARHAGPGGKAGELFGRAVPWEEFQQEHQLLSRSLRAQMGTIPEAFEPFLRQQTWDRLILKAEAKRTIRISDEQVAQYLRTQPTFQLKGAFSPELYYQFVRSLGTSPKPFEEQVRDDLRLQRLTEMVQAEVRLTDEELKAAYAKTHERLRVAYVAFPTSDVTAEATHALTEQDLRASYDAHHEALQIPTQRRIDYVGLSRAEALAQTPAQPTSDEELQAYLEQHEDEFAPAAGGAVATAEGSLPALQEVRPRVLEAWRAQQAGKKLMDASLDLQDAIDLGIRFEELAAATGLTLHTTPLMNISASDVPMGPTASMVRDAFQVPLGRLTRVSHEPSGVFVLRAIEEIPASVPPFEQVREPVRQLAVKARAREAAKAKAVAVREQLLAKRTEGLTPQEGWLALSLLPTRPAPITRKDALEGIGQAPGLTDALFAAVPGQYTDVLEGSEGFALALVEERLPFDEAQFATDKERFRAEALTAKQQEHVAAWLADLRTRAHLKDLTTASKTPSPS